MKKNLCFLLAFILSQALSAQVTDFEGITYSGDVPADPVLAVSEVFIVQAVNSKIVVFNKTGEKLFEKSLSDFFSNQSPPELIFDPKVAYDQYSNRFILLVAARNSNTTNSNYMLAVTQNSDPTGDWYKYKLTAIDQQYSQYYIDYPGLGYDEEAIYLTSHQIYGTEGSQSYYPKITILDKTEVYSGVINYRKDLIDFNSSGSYPAKLKPMRKFGSSDGYYLVNTENPGQIRIWKIANPLSSQNATVSVATTITLGNYSYVSEAEQKGTTYKVDIGDYSISDVVCMNGLLYGTYTVQNSTKDGSMIVYFEIDTKNNFELLKNGKIEYENKYYYYPMLHPDNQGNIVFVFNKSSSNDYIGVAWTILYTGNTDVEPIKWLKQGTTWYHHLLNDKNRWGDYCGIALDPSNSYRVWICGEWAYSNTQWSTWIGEIKSSQPLDFSFTNTIYDEETGVLGENAGGTLRVNSNIVNSGETFPLEIGETYTETTDYERFVNWNSSGYTYKHNNWNNDIDKKFLSNIFLAKASETTHKAFFKSLNYSKITVMLEGQLISGKGNGEFQDPWFVLNDGSQPGNYWEQFSSFYEPNGKYGAAEKGVFLGQAPDPNDSTKPYYSVKAVSPQTININGANHTFYFQNWEASPSGSATFQDANAAETPVVFNNAGATVKAVMKGTQLSNYSAAYSNNNQRKTVAIRGGEYISVYESMGKIWIEKLKLDGTWGLMENGDLASNIYECKNPSIAVDGNNLFIVFQENISNTRFNVRLMAFDVAGNSAVTLDNELVRWLNEDVSYDNVNPVIAIT